MFLWRELLGPGTRVHVNNEAETFSGRGSSDFSDVECVDVLHAGLKEPWEGKLDKEIHRTPRPINTTNVVLPILLIACDRTTVSRSLDLLLKYNPNKKRFPIIVSQDCGHKPTADVIQRYVSEHGIQHIKEMTTPFTPPHSINDYSLLHYHCLLLPEIQHIKINWTLFLVWSFIVTMRGISIQMMFNVMPAALAELEIPPVYAMLFFLSLFICGFMFLCVAMLTIVDHIVDSLTTRFVRLHDRKHCCTFVTAFFLMVALICMGLLMTTTAGFYYVILLDQSITRLRFITVLILAVSVIIVYVKHTFSIVERILISIWCILAATATAGFWLYSFIMYLGFPLSYNGHEYTKVFDLVSWIISAVPYIAIPAAAMHSCGLFEKTCKERMQYMFCGAQGEPRDYQGYYPAPEPSAPPAYSYNTNSYNRNGAMLYPMADVHKDMYDPELEPLDTRLRSSQI